MNDVKTYYNSISMFRPIVHLFILKSFYLYIIFISIRPMEYLHFKTTKKG